MNLKALHEEFISSAHRPMTFGRLPIEPQQPDHPIIPMDKWELDRTSHKLRKRYRFRTCDQRDDFVRALLAYEREVQHQARISIEPEWVFIEINTKGANLVTGLDKEYARYADILYKDVVYSSRYEQEEEPL